MKVIRNSQSHADAVQWLGTSQSLQEIQALLAPASPYYGGDFKQDLQYRSLGVPVSQATTYGDAQRLEHVSPTGWVVKDGQVVMVMSDEQFRRSYTQMQEGVGIHVQSGGNQISGNTIVATHPRAIITDIETPKGY